MQPLSSHALANDQRPRARDPPQVMRSGRQQHSLNLSTGRGGRDGERIGSRRPHHPGCLSYPSTTGKKLAIHPLPCQQWRGGTGKPDYTLTSNDGSAEAGGQRGGDSDSVSFRDG